jgi:hypothetical protein
LHLVETNGSDAAVIPVRAVFLRMHRNQVRKPPEVRAFESEQVSHIMRFKNGREMGVVDLSAVHTMGAKEAPPDHIHPTVFRKKRHPAFDGGECAAISSKKLSRSASLVSVSAGRGAIRACSAISVSTYLSGVRPLA